MKRERYKEKKEPGVNDVLIIYFHGNAEDISDNIHFLNHLHHGLNVSVLAMEYPGYGFFKNRFNGGEINEDWHENWLWDRMPTTSAVIKESAKTIYEHAIAPVQHGGLGFYK